MAVLSLPRPSGCQRPVVCAVVSCTWSVCCASGCYMLGECAVSGLHRPWPIGHGLWVVRTSHVVSCLFVCAAHLLSVGLLPCACVGVSEVLPVMVPRLLFGMRVSMLWVVHEGLRHSVL